MTTPLTHMPLANGEIFAGYTIVRLLGSGGMGEVYLAEHPRLPRRDALKILGSDVSADEDYRRRFIREADLAATLWHPNIVRVNDRGEFNEQLWIAMDYVDGTDAARLLRDRYPAGMPADEVVAIITAIASALDYAHARGLLHRDVKPANIMLANPEDGERRILLGDFGIARTIGDVSGLTATNMTVGTLPYAAPEQLMDDPIDGRADQYALAATAYHLLTGSPLFPQSNPAAVISRHLNSPPPAVADSHPELAGLDQVLARALAKDPANRFVQCMDFARAFAAATQPGVQAAAAAPTMQAPVTAKAVDSRPIGTPRPKTERRGLQWPLIVAIVVILAAVAGITGYLLRPGSPGSQTPTAQPAPAAEPSSSASSSASATPSSATAQPTDYSALLIKASDIPGGAFKMQPPQPNPGGHPGVAALFANDGDTREIGDTIMVLPDASDAASVLRATITAAGPTVSGGTPQPADVGTGGTKLTGTSPDGAKSITILMFSEGRAVVTIEFDGAANDPVPQDGALDIARKQDAAIKAGLPI